MASQDPYPLVAHSLLDAVNICLRAKGSGNVLALDTASLTADAESALKTVHDVSIQLQQSGWQWNTEKALKIDPHPQDGSAAAGVITLPFNTLKLIATNASTGRNYVQRGNYLYDPFASSSNIGVTVTCRLIVALDYEDLPQAARQYIAAKAARIFVANRKNNQITTNAASQEEGAAMIAMLEAEDQDDDLTWPEKNVELGARRRHRRRNY